jgi:hypothetical protein
MAISKDGIENIDVTDPPIIVTYSEDSSDIEDVDTSDPPTRKTYTEDEADD